MLIVWIGVLALAGTALGGGARSTAVAESCSCHGDRNATYTRYPNPCPRTCSNHKNTTKCDKPTPEYGCECNKGYVLSPSGKCILPKDCPVICHRHAVYKKCPNPCPRTCEYPNGLRICPRACLEHGCECKPGYVLSPDGRCVHLQDCPGAKNCSCNETFVACSVKCPNSYCPVDDSRAIIACDPPNPCRSGCACRANYRRLSRNQDKCILATDCPPVKCKRPNEVWNPCPSNCLAERCTDIGKNQTECNKPYSYCEPQCVCKEGFYRNDSDICIPAKECVKCPRNAVYKKCPNPCQGTCEYPSGIRPCTRLCPQYGCECEPGYVLSEGKCILLKECPGAKSCTKNETFVACKAGCPTNFCPRDDSRARVACSPPNPCPSGCVCQANYRRLNQNDTRCIRTTECPPVKCTRPNEKWNSCPSNCLADRCEDIGKNQTDCNKPYSYCDPQCVCKKGFYRNSSDICIPAIDCPGQCPIKPECRPTCAVPNPPNCTYFVPPAKNIDGCQCIDGYILSEKGGKCIKVEECPDNLGCNYDPQAVVRKCPSPCPSTCDSPDATPCKKLCLSVGCECKPGYILSEEGGKCILPDKCKGGNPCGPNGTFVQCKSSCPNDYCPVDDSRGILICEYYPFSPCYSGCICRVNHKRRSREDRRCIASADCPPVKCTRQNEIWDSCPRTYLGETCRDIDSPPVNSLLLNCQPGCVCAKNYYRNDSDICISAKECRKKACGLNENPVKCVDTCTQTCDSLFTDNICNPTICEPGCDCISNYRRNSSGVCIPESECVPPFTPPPLQCGFNEEMSDCAILCPPQTCDSIFTSYSCNKTECTVGCNCLDQHLRNGSGICVPSEQCFGFDSCPISQECRPTCAVPNPPNCPAKDPPSKNEDGCQCQLGSILSNASGTCIKIEECPQDAGCNGDPNAVVKACPWSCPATCDSPNTILCRKACLPVGCQCAPGYILSEENGTCILPEQCNCGNPCGVNGTFSDCGFKCPNQYCPEDDSLLKYACKPGRPCPPGCQCKEGYRRKSYDEDNVCVLAYDCPPVDCTRPNEVWNPCSQCLAEGCEDVNRPVLCADPPGTNCDPRCVCIDGYYRDENKLCIPKKECKIRGEIDY